MSDKVVRFLTQLVNAEYRKQELETKAMKSKAKASMKNRRR